MIYFIYFSFSLTSYSARLLGRKIRSYVFVNVPPVTIRNFRPKCSKSIPVFRLKRLKNHTLWGGTYLYTGDRGVPPPPGRNISQNAGVFPRYLCMIKPSGFMLFAIVGV